MLQIDQGDIYKNGAYWDVGDMGSGRGVGIYVSSSFHMNSIGMDLALREDAYQQSYEYEIFSSVDGQEEGALLTSTDFSLVNGEGWQDVAFDYDFQAGNYYVINFSLSGDTSGPLGSDIGCRYSWEPSALINYGVLEVVQGFEADPPDPSNPLVAHTRINYVPEPATLCLLSLGSLLLRKRRA